MNRSTILTAALALALAPAMLAAQTSPSTRGVVPAPETKLPRKHAPEPTTAAINAKDMMTRLYIFADDSMQGREAGTQGNVKGTDYIAREVKRMGLVPMGDNGGFFQTIPFKSRALDGASTMSADGASLKLFDEFSATGDISGANLPVIFGGMLGDSSLTSDQTAGKMVVLLAGPTSTFRSLRAAPRAYPSAAGIAVIAAPALIAFTRRPSQFLDNPNGSERPARGVVYLTANGAARLFDSPLEQLKPGTAGKSVTVDAKMKVEPVPFPARNVIALLPGSDAKLKGEYIAVGAHNDHVGFNNRPVDHDSIRIFNHIVRPGGAEDSGNQATAEQMAEINKLLAEWRASHPGTQRPDSINNGADDDGSGSVGVLEIAEKLAAMKTKPKRSILFVWHVGEEKGLLGSQYFADHPTVPRDSIVAQLNIDMIGRGDAWDETGKTKSDESIHGGPNYLQLIGSRRLSKELGDMVEQTNVDGKYSFTFDYSLDANGHPMNIYCRSDHANYARYGIPITFFTTGGHSDYHQVTDEPQYIDYDHMVRSASLVADVAVKSANLDHRIVVDQPKPDPKVRCQQ